MEYQKLIQKLDSQAKLDVLVLETGVSDFCGFNPTRGKTYPFILNLSQLLRTPGGDLSRTALVIS
jgi:hypothetical protein